MPINLAIVLVVLTIIVAGAAIAIVDMVFKHQRQLWGVERGATSESRVDAIKMEVAELKDLVHQQTIALDRLATLPRGDEVRERVGG